MLLALILNAAANLMMKFGVKRFGDSGASLEQGILPVGASLLTNWVLVLGIVFFATNVLFYTYALSGIKISVAYPVMVCTGFVIIALVAWKCLGETLSPLQWAGVVMVLVGVVLVAREMDAAPGT